MDKFPFPQADDFQKIERLMTVNNEADLGDFTFMSAYLDGITERQVSYYLSAMMYLGLIDKEKCFTERGRSIRRLDNYSRKVELSRVLIADDIVGKIYITQKILGVHLDTEDIIELIKDAYPEYTEPIYKRRAQTVRSWMGWLEESLSGKN